MSEDDDQHDYELVSFVFDLRREDLLGTVIRAQTHIEHALRQFILANAVSPQHAKCDELDFDGIVRLAMILGLNAETKPAFAALSALHKKLVRNPNIGFGPDDANNFYNSLSPTLKGIIREAYQEVRVEENLGEFKRQSPFEKLVLFLTGIWSFVLTERKHGPDLSKAIAELPVGFVEELKKRRFEFIKLMDSGDDLQLVIRGHTHIEHELREFVLAAAPEPVAVKLAEYDYAGTLGLALILGLDQSLEAGLQAVGALRNKFAHRLNMSLTEQVGKGIYATLDATSQADALQAWSAAYRNSPNAGRPEVLLEAQPRDIVATSMAMLFMGILVEQLKRRRTGLKRQRA